MKYIITIICALLAVSMFSQQVTKATYDNVLLKNATVHTITQGSLNNTDVLIQDGRIARIGSNASGPRIR